MEVISYKDFKTQNKKGTTIYMDLEEESYAITVERGALARASQLMNLDRRVLIVTDDGVPVEYAETVARQCGQGFIVVLPQGEATKNFDSFRRLLSEMLAHSFTRTDCVVAVGGGVTGDLSGFAAACYMRGIDFYNIPTTLLSQVDSSIGGKTAIDLDGVKNIAGAFYQPEAVLIDPDTLGTLSERQLHAGLAEAIKMAATYDDRLFARIENSSDLQADLQDIIIGALLIKKDVVQQDPKEAGLRKILNFGHTLGHAIESFAAGSLLHGECVAAGMIPMCSPSAAKRIMAVLGKYELPVNMKEAADLAGCYGADNTDVLAAAGPKELMPYVMHDKKMQKDTVSAIYVGNIGSCEIIEMTPEQMRERIELL